MTTEVPVSSVVVGDRFRSSNPHQATLTESIRRLGLLHAPVVNSRMELVAGFRRLLAVKALGWATVPVTVATTFDEATRAILAERDENTCREPLSVADMLKIGTAIEAIEKDAAKKRMEQGRPPNEPELTSDILSEVNSGRAREKVGDALGISGTKYEQIKKVAASGIPALFDAVDKGEVSASAAAVVATLPKEEQAATVAAGPKAVKEKAQVVKAERKEQAAAQPAAKAKGKKKRDPKPGDADYVPAPRRLDPFGMPITKNMIDTFEDVSLRAVAEQAEALRAAADALREIVEKAIRPKQTWFTWVSWTKVDEYLERLAESAHGIDVEVTQGMPHAVCPECGGDPMMAKPPCKACRLTGYWPEYMVLNHIHKFKKHAKVFAGAAAAHGAEAGFRKVPGPAEEIRRLWRKLGDLERVELLAVLARTASPRGQNVWDAFDGGAPVG